MTYSKERAASISKSDIKYIPAGIIENVVLKSVKTEVSPNGNQFLEIVFEKDGATLTHTEWKPTLGGFVTTEEQLQTKMDKQYSRMLQILNCYYKDEELDFNGESFEQFAQWITDMLNKVDKSKKLRAKIVYNDKGYTTLPNYAKYTFIEPMQLAEGAHYKISELSIDKFTKSIIADNETTSTDPLTANNSVNTNNVQRTSNSVLPFLYKLG